MKLEERMQQLQAHPDRVERVAVEKLNIQPLAVLAFEHILGGLKMPRDETDARNFASVQIRGKLGRFEPRRADHLKRRIGAAAYRDDPRFEQACSGIQCRLGEI